ncbi:uncharacterized protein [Centruroides vittatus]|uniref:uncharacterized protein n=1 Tax=Centruroides vittatus TaxID=120091 RepID=UPI00350FA106
MRFLCFLLAAALLVTTHSDTRASSKSAKDEKQLNLANTLHHVLREKLEEVREIILHGHSGTDIPPLDPFLIDSVSFVVRESAGFVNVTLEKTVVTGLGDFRIKDVASNFDSMRTSVSMNCPEIRILSSYRIKGYLHPPLSQSIGDVGRFEAVLKNFDTSWSAKVKFGKREDDIVLVQTSLTSFYDRAVKKFRNLAKKPPLTKAEDLLGEVGDSIIERIQNYIEDNLYRSVQQIINKGASTSFGELIDEVQTQSSGRVKRQVPCENGQDLDEYVDTLLRFGRRLIRLMEPFRFPNTSVKVEDFQILIFLYNGGVRGISTVERRKSAYVMCKNESITLGIVLGFEQLKVQARYRVMKDYRTLLFNGDADIRVTGTEALVQITQMMNGVARQNLDKLKIRRLGEIRVLLRGLGNLTSALSMLLTQQLNEDPQSIINVAEAQVASMIRQQLTNVTIPIFSIV